MNTRKNTDDGLGRRRGERNDYDDDDDNRRRAAGHINGRWSTDVQRVEASPPSSPSSHVETQFDGQNDRKSQNGGSEIENESDEDDDEDYDDEDERDSYRQQSRIFVEGTRTEWKGKRRPEGAEHENWFLFDNSRRFHLKFHLRRYWRRLRRAAARGRELLVDGVPWHHVRIGFVFFLFVASMALFMSVDMPDEDPKTHLAAVALDAPLISLHSFIPISPLFYSLSIYFFSFSLLKPVILNINSEISITFYFYVCFSSKHQLCIVDGDFLDPLPHYRPLTDDKPIDTIRVNLGIQETRNLSASSTWPAKTIVTVTLEASSAPSE